MVRRYVDLGVDEIALADSIGVAVPSQVSAMVERVLPLLGTIPLRLHFHNTRNTGIANVYAAARLGVRIFDASCGGVGGCPFAPGATGNLATEDLIYLLDGLGHATSVSIDRVARASLAIESAVGHRVPSRYTSAVRARLGA